MGDISQSVGHIPGGLFIVTVVDGEQKEGYLASWIQQASFNPLLISLAIKEGRPCYAAVMGGGIFAVNVVGKHEADYLKHFWKGYETSPFNAIGHTISSEGALIMDKAKSAMVCRLHSHTKPGDHDIVFAEVLNSYTMNEGVKSKVHVRKSGMDY